MQKYALRRFEQQFAKNAVTLGTCPMRRNGKTAFCGVFAKTFATLFAVLHDARNFFVALTCLQAAFLQAKITDRVNALAFWLLGGKYESSDCRRRS